MGKLGMMVLLFTGEVEAHFGGFNKFKFEPLFGNNLILWQFYLGELKPKMLVFMCKTQMIGFLVDSISKGVIPLHQKN